MKKNRLYSICRNDILLAAAVLIAAAVLFLILLAVRGNVQGDVAVIRVDGKEYGTYPLDRDEEITIDTALGHNRIRISSGSVCMLETDCPDGYCARQGAVSRNGDTIVCLPHRVVVEIRAGDAAQAEYDVIAY